MPKYGHLPSGEMTLDRLLGMGEHQLMQLPTEQLRQAAALFHTEANRDRKENAIKYYQPNSNACLQYHLSKAQTVAAGGGNRSGKTEAMMVELVSCMTGVFPESLKSKIKMSDKFRGPIHCRVVVESLTTTLYPTILPKLMWNTWTGIDEPWGDRGHFGWVPRYSLINGSWKQSWDNKLRVLRVICREPETMKVLGESTLQCMSKDQDPQDFASGEFHICAHDEPPTEAIWRENEMRTMSVNGRMLLAMTWYDDPAIPVDYIYDNIYEPGMDSKNEDIEWINYFTSDNPNIDQEAIAKRRKAMSRELAAVRFEGKPIRFSNRIHPEFTDQTQIWCFTCHCPVATSGAVCTNCGSEDTQEYNHVVEGGWDHDSSWPVVYVLDMHPRKDHMMSWWVVNPANDLWCIAEHDEPGDPTDCRRIMDQIEGDLQLNVMSWLCDPNMGASEASYKRGKNWQQAFREAQIPVQLADPAGQGVALINTMLKPDSHTRAPRMLFHPRCGNAITHFNRFAWADYKRSLEKDQNQRPRDKYSDYPAMARYLVNSDPTFDFLMIGDHFIRKRGQNRTTNVRVRRRDVPQAKWTERQLM